MDLESEIDIFYDCDECPKTFPSVSQLEVHKEEAHQKKNKCLFCDHIFDRTSSLKYHMKMKHAVEARSIHSCDFCPENFPKKRLLTEHLHLFHHDEKVHVCQDCNKSFFSKVGLKHHVTVVHESKLTFSCPECSLSFRREATLEKHIDKEHLDLGKEKDFYKCDECGKLLPKGCLFHVCKNEVPLTCEECGDSFTNSNDFKIHKRTAHSLARYSCPECKKVIVDTELMKLHIRRYHAAKHLELEADLQDKPEQENQRTFNNVKNHKCQFCEVAFARPENLRRHVQRLHKKKVSSTLQLFPNVD